MRLHGKPRVLGSRKTIDEQGEPPRFFIDSAQAGNCHQFTQFQSRTKKSKIAKAIYFKLIKY